MYRTHVRDISHLKASLKFEELWNFDEEIIDWAIKQWRPSSEVMRSRRKRQL